MRERRHRLKKTPPPDLHDLYKALSRASKTLHKLTHERGIHCIDPEQKHDGDDEVVCQVEKLLSDALVAVQGRIYINQRNV